MAAGAADVIGRLGGDEFTVLAHAAGPHEADRVRERLAARLARRKALPGRRYALAMIIGVAAFDPARPTPLPALMRAADEALYAAKARRKGVAGATSLADRGAAPAAR